jgi:hypothetical protein
MSLRTSSSLFGRGASRSPFLRITSDLFTFAVAVAGAAVGALFVTARSDATSADAVALSLDVLFDLLIPGLAGVSACVSTVLCVRAALRRASSAFGRKSLLVAVSAMLFAASTFYRSLNIASEGAALCRGEPTVFNAPLTGRSVATVGEIALVVQASIFIEEAARRLGAARGPWSLFCSKYTQVHFSTIAPVIAAEVFSWSGVLRLAGKRSALFFCCEYVMWMLIAGSWAWDCAELLHKSTKFMDLVAFTVLMLTGVVLFFFNAFLELPHFFSGADRDENMPGLWECVQSRDSPLWRKRLPFFVLYFIGASFIAVAGANRFMLSVRNDDDDSATRDKEKSK